MRLGYPVLGIRIRMLLGLLNPDQLVRGMDLDPDPGPALVPDPSIKQNSKKSLDSYYFVTSFGLVIVEK
jgi:hypothetical protein